MAADHREDPQPRVHLTPSSRWPHDPWALWDWNLGLNDFLWPGTPPKPEFARKRFNPSTPPLLQEGENVAGHKVFFVKKLVKKQGFGVFLGGYNYFGKGEKKPLLFKRVPPFFLVKIHFTVL